MELREFIAKTLLNITEGVAEANKSKGRFEIVGSSARLNHGDFVEFDVSIAVTESSEEGKKMGMVVALANVMAGKSKDEKKTQLQENFHRLKFRIFVKNN